MSDAGAIEAAPRAHWSDRLNPILVKEVRQALRGRYFKILFWLTLTCAVVIGLVVIGNAAADRELDQVGRFFFMCMLYVLVAAVHAFVPFSAFLATSAEWDENTWDLLVISNLKPRQLVLGKLFSAIIQALLFYSAFAPFLVFAFLLNGVDLMSIAVILPGSMLTCAALSLFGIALSSLSRVRFLRILLMALFGAALLGAAGGTMGLAYAVVQYPNMLRDPNAWIGISAYATAAIVLAGFSFAAATARFAHDEENRSTIPRVTTLLLIVAAAAWAAWAVKESGANEPVWISQFCAAIVAFIPLLLFATEEEQLRRGVAKRVPKNRMLALLCAPFLPGGGRGVLFLGLLGFVALASIPIELEWITLASDEELLQTYANVAVTYGFLALHIALIGGLASFFVRTRWARTAVRWTIFASVPFALFAPALIGLFFGIRDWMQLEHPLNPVMVLDGIRRGINVNARVGIGVLCVTTIAAVILNAPRALAGVSEVLAASRARRER